MAPVQLLGIEIGGTKLQLGLGDGLGNLRCLERRRIDPAAGASGILAQIADSFEVLLTRAGLAREDIAAAGVGFGGPIDSEHNRVEKSFQVAGWEGFSFDGWTREHLGINRVALGNDADVAGLAEARFGAGIGQSPLFYMTVGSGIGGALILDNQIYAGAGRGAMEIGHLAIPCDPEFGPSPRELEQLASGWGIGAAARELVAKRPELRHRGWPVLELAGGQVERITAECVAIAAGKGDETAAAILGRARSALAFALTQLIALAAPRRIVIGGGVSLIGDDLWFEPIRKLVDRDVFPPFRNSYDIVPAALGEDVVVHGALALARNVAG
jgi:glucokinase